VAIEADGVLLGGTRHLQDDVDAGGRDNSPTEPDNNAHHFIAMDLTSFFPHRS
jgi:hypothetical protein